MKSTHTIRFAAALVAASVLVPVLTSQEKDKKKDPADQAIVLSPFEISAGPSVGYSAASTLAGTRLGATVGGAKDARYFRDTVTQGGFPHPNTITAEGLFSEHDLPVPTEPPNGHLLQLSGEATTASLLTRPEVRYLGQIGLASGLDASTWHRQPLNLIAVVDKSGSMHGYRLGLVKDSLHRLQKQLGPDDQISIVLYGDRSYVHLEPMRVTAANQGAISAAIDAMETNGSTDMEEGLKVGYDLARRTRRSFAGCTRLMQFTDECPNTGNTTAEGFMGQMEEGARDGIGQTTIGIGDEFDAELATKVSAVHGANLFYFPNAQEMEKTFSEELDMLVTELAFDLDMTIHPAPGLRIAGVYGIPSDLLRWEGDRNLTFHVNTIFLSKRKGAIYVAFAPEDADLPEHVYTEGRPLATLRLSYRETGRALLTKGRLELPFVAAASASPGLQRGSYLVSEYLGLKAAMTAHVVENNRGKAYAMLSQLHQLLSTADASLEGERTLTAQLLELSAKASGHDAGPDQVAASSIILDQ